MEKERNFTIAGEIKIYENGKRILTLSNKKENNVALSPEYLQAIINFACSGESN